VIVGCFGDPGLEALRRAAREPVFGLAESSIREADALGEPFAILTMGKAWVDMLNELMAMAAVRARFVGVFAGEGTGLDVSRQETSALGELDRLAREAVAAGARTLILGGAALTGMADRLKADARLIDCVEATIRSALAAKPAA
jgi:Asp/Glu/hydantoin racemase